MKSKFIIIFFLSLVTLCNAQTVYLYTPNGSQVYAFKRTEMSPADIAYCNADCASSFPNADILATASSTYNCHSYAWNLTEGGTTICWLNQYPDLQLYWDDGSYEQTTEANAVKIFYYDGDHSAVKSTTHIGKYESKWGSYPLVRHSPDYGPYTNMQNRRYYRLACATPVINFHNQTVTTNTTITNSCGNIDVQNVTVTNGSTLTIEASSDINVREVYVINNSSLILEAAGETTIERDFEVELGSEFEIKVNP